MYIYIYNIYYIYNTINITEPYYKMMYYYLYYIINNCIRPMHILR